MFVLFVLLLCLSVSLLRVFVFVFVFVFCLNGLFVLRQRCYVAVVLCNCHC